MSRDLVVKVRYVVEIERHVCNNNVEQGAKHAMSIISEESAGILTARDMRSIQVLDRYSGEVLHADPGPAANTKTSMMLYGKSYALLSVEEREKVNAYDRQHAAAVSALL